MDKRLKKIKLITIIGARPQMIKSAAISRTIQLHFSEVIDEILVHTGQHYDSNMSQVFFEELKIPKEKYNLKVGSGSHAYQTATMMLELERIFQLELPNAVLLYGDTNSTLAACLTAAKMFIPIIHIEAGVRSYNNYFPEEINRLICDHLSTLLFVPTIAGIKGLGLENIHHSDNDVKPKNFNQRGVYLTGDIMYDNSLYFSKTINHDLYKKQFETPPNYILLTMHRPSNVDTLAPIQQIIEGVCQIANKADKPVLFPVHPRTKAILQSNPSLMDLLRSSKIRMMEPASFLEMTFLEQHADLVITDSGGVQKEAYFFNKPCIILLEETPWVELVASKTAVLVGNNKKAIVDAYHSLTLSEPTFDATLYGNGDSSKFILQTIIDNLN